MGVRGEMRNLSGRLPFKKKMSERGMKRWPDGVRARLPKSVVEARAGLIPSEEIDTYPPPDGLTAAELLRWYQGFAVLLRTK